MLTASTQNKYPIPAEDHGLESGQPVVRGAQRRPRHYKPLATKSVCLLLILGALLICITLLEVIFHQGAHRTSNTNLGKREIRRQDALSTTDGGTAADPTVAAASTAVPAASPTTPGISAAETTVVAASRTQPASNPTSAAAAPPSTISDVSIIGAYVTLTSDSPSARTSASAVPTAEPTANPTSPAAASLSIIPVSELSSELTLTSDSPVPSTYDSAVLTLTTGTEGLLTFTTATEGLLTLTTATEGLLTLISSTTTGTGGLLTLTLISTDAGSELSLTSQLSTSHRVTTTSTPSVELSLTSSKPRVIVPSTSKTGVAISLTSSATLSTTDPTGTAPVAPLSLTSTTKSSRLSDSRSTDSTTRSNTTETNLATSPAIFLSTSGAGLLTLTSTATITSKAKSSTTHTAGVSTYRTETVIQGSQLSLASSTTARNGLGSSKPLSATTRMGSTTEIALITSTITTPSSSEMSATIRITEAVSTESGAQLSLTGTRISQSSNALSSTVITEFPTAESGAQLTLTSTISAQASAPPSGTVQQNSEITSLSTALIKTTDSSGQTTSYYLVVEQFKTTSDSGSAHASTALITTTDSSGQTTSYYLVVEQFKTTSDVGSTQASATLITTTDSSGQITSYYLVVEQVKTTLNSGSAHASTTMVGGPEITSELTMTASISAAATTALSLPHILSTEMVIEGPFQKVDYIKAMYLGPFIAVALKMAWDVVFSSTKMMEPFYQLAKPGGASAHDSLCADYLSSGLSWNSWKVMFGGHWVMALTTAIYITMGSLAPVASESMTVKAGGFCVTPVSTHQPCDPMWVIDVVVSRGLEGLLALNALMIAILILIASRRRSDVYSNPSSIASMAALLGDPTVIEEFRQIDPQASPEALRMALSENRYTLGQYATASGTIRVGLTKSNDALNPGHSYGALHTNYEALSNPANITAIPQRTIPWILILEICFLLSILTLFGLVLGYYLDAKSDPLNNFFNSGVFGPRFILTFIAILIDGQWKRLEREVRITEPYRILSKRRTPPQSTVLASMNGTPITSLPIALWRRNFFHAWVSFVAFLSDVLIIAVAGVPFTEAQIHPSLLASCYTSLCILGLMFCTVVALLFWRRSNPRMPRPPETMATVFMYLCGSRMVDDFHDMETIGTELRDEAVRRSGRKYWFGLALGKGGQERWMVDHEKEGSMVFY